MDKYNLRSSGTLGQLDSGERSPNSHLLAHPVPWTAQVQQSFPQAAPVFNRLFLPAVQMAPRSMYLLPL